MRRALPALVGATLALVAATATAQQRDAGTRHAPPRDAGAAATAHPHDAGVPAAPPGSRAALPPIEPRIAAALAHGLTEFDAAMRLHAPRMTDAVDPQKLNRRIRELFVPWLTAREAAMTRAEQDLFSGSDREEGARAVAAALVALMWEDFAWQVSHIAPPRGLRDHAVMVQLWNEAIDEQTAPLRERAASAYGACVQAGAIRPGVSTAFTTLCAERLALLDARDAGAPDAGAPDGG